MTRKSRLSLTGPSFYARLTGALYLVLLLCGPFSLMYVPSKLIVPDNAGRTAARIVASETLFRFGMASNMVIFLTEIAVIGLLYTLFKPVSPLLSRVAAFARLAMAGIQGVNVVLMGGMLALLGGATYLYAFDLEQLNALALFLFHLQGTGAHVWEAFFAMHCGVLAVLIYRSGFLPKQLGLLMAIAALGYWVESFGSILWPQHKKTYATIVGLGAALGEVPFLAWLLVKGVDTAKWRSAG